MHFSTPTPHRLACWLLTCTLLGAGTTQAQTMVDISASIGIQNTLNSIGTPNPAAPIKAAQNVAQTVAQAQSAAAPTTPTTPSSATPGQARPAVSITPLTAAQQAALDMAQASFKAKQYAQARKQYEALIAQNYNNPEPHFGLAMTMLALKDDKGATFELGQFRLLAPDRFEGPYNLGVIATRAGRYDEALALYGEAARLAEKQATPEMRTQVLSALASEQARKNDFAGLTTTLSALRELQPGDQEVQYRLAQAQTLSGQGTQALPGLYDLLQKSPRNVNAIRLLADVYVGQGLPDRALRELNAGLSRVTDKVGRSALLLHKANLLAVTGDTRAAVFSAQAAHTEDPTNAEAWMREGQLRLQRGDRGGAVTAMQGAVKADPRNPRYRTEVAALELALKRYPEAAQNAAQALTLRPDPATQARAQYLQGVALYQQGKYAQARTLLNSSAIAVPNAETTLWLGLTNYALKDFSGAAAALSESVKLNPTPTARINLASAYLASARYSEAEGILQGIVKDNAKNSAAWYLLGLAQRAQLKEEEARQSFKTALNLGDARAREALK